MPSQSRVARLIISLGVLLATVPALAAEESATLVIEPFPRAELVERRQLDNADHGVVLGNIRRINNQLRAEQEVRAVGDLLRMTWRIPEGHSASEAFLHAKQQLLDQPHTMLYFCEARECGSSSLWANQVFGFSRLYGPEENQAYVAIRLDSEPQRFVSLYSITRGNRKVYLHMDQFTPEDPVQTPLYPTPSTLIKVLRTDGELQLPELDVSDGDRADTRTWLELLNRMLRSDTRLRVALHGEDAGAVAQTLRDLGLRGDRVEIGNTEEAGLRVERL
ncbi:protein of unknown function [Halopseudomonas xinjiangensis]|uniref:DUF4892 domain-containing protein n=1 Tax=Halopseudomonas xinjiangensis TaxID=487184 RepID=A0A1H1PP21_9GAMM|nr:DUF4892 domain-containing protein [Halopseudomonas xinjiangensis]SDS12870.1 protein of unknown function [Halopseudomonas xinjiangensis]